MLKLHSHGNAKQPATFLFRTSPGLQDVLRACCVPVSNLDISNTPMGPYSQGG